MYPQPRQLYNDECHLHKAIFTDKTICENLSHIALYVNFELDYTIKFKSEWHTYDHHCIAVGKCFTEKYNSNLGG